MKADDQIRLITTEDSQECSLQSVERLTWDESASGSHGTSIPLVFPHLPCTSSHLFHHHTLCPLVLPLPIIMHEYRLSNIKLSIHSVVDSVVVKHPVTGALRFFCCHVRGVKVRQGVVAQVLFLWKILKRV